MLEPFLLKRTTQLDQSLYLLWDWCFDPTLTEESSVCSSGQACIRRDSRACSLPSKNIQDWSRVDTFKLIYHDKSCPPELTNWAGKAACFGQLMRGQSQTSGHAVCCQKVSRQSLQFKESSIVVTGKKYFLPGLIDVAFLG